ncbi:MAG: YdeI/OmpD-associated family protein [Cucumibacter sp.]
MKIAADIETALKAGPSALEAFEKLPPSHRREYLEWVAEAKRPETRARRIAGMIERLAGAGADGQA